MPRGDGTGPMGIGPMTGRGVGFCSGYASPGYMNPTRIRGWGFRHTGGWRRGLGMGMGWRHGSNAPVHPFAMQYAPPFASPDISPVGAEKEIDMLKNQARYFSDALQEINKRIAEIESGKQ